MNIVVCGGGTAGWLAAYIIQESQPHVHKVHVIESSTVGIIGAGEGSTGILWDIVRGTFFGRSNSIDDFMARTDATPKLGIRHTNWAKTYNSYFAPLDGSPTRSFSPDVTFNHVLSEYGNEKVYLSSYIGQHFEKNKMPSGGFGFHFDAHKVGKYFKELLEADNLVTSTDALIVDVNVDSSGNIESVTLDNGDVVEGDFFIDCTGFARVLMKKLGVGWHSYKQYLPVDRAMPFILPYTKEQKNEGVEPVTIAHALSSGWMWNIPLQTRIGAGYVYCSDFISEDEAQREVELLLGREIEPIRHIKFDSGRSDVLWKNNCLATGLAGAFSEPLEATSIHSTIMQLLVFCLEYLTPNKQTTLDDSSINGYNRVITRLYDDYCDFINLHYQGGKDTSEFWKEMQKDERKTEFVKEVIAHSKNRIPSSLQYSGQWGSSSHLWNWILAGLHLIKPETAKEELDTFGKDRAAALAYKHFQAEHHYLDVQFSQFKILPSQESI